MKLEVTTIGDPDSTSLTISEPVYWYFRSAFEKLAEETGIDVDIDCDTDAKIEGACLLELFLALEPLASEVRGSSDRYLQEVGLVEERDQMMMYQTPRDEGLAMIEGLMERANTAYNDGFGLRIRSASERDLENIRTL